MVCLLCAVFPPVAAAAVPSWHGERPLPQAVGSGARVAITSAGDVAVAWQDAGKGLSVAVRPAGGRFGSPRRLSRSGRWVEGLDLVADSRGRLVVVWGDTECCRVPANRRVWASTREPGGQFSAPVALSGPINSAFTSLVPAVAVGEGGSLTVVWPADIERPAKDGIATVIEVADRLPGGGFGPPTRLSAPDVNGFAPSIASGPSGETVVLWSSRICRAAPCNYELLAATRPRGGRFEAPELVAVPYQPDFPSRGLVAGQVQIALDGTAVALWVEPSLCMYCYGAVVKAARRPLGQRFGSAQRLGRLGGSGPFLALDAEDRAFAVWGDANIGRDTFGQNPRVFGAEARPHEAFGRGSRLERGGDALGIAPGGGGAIAAWTRNEKVIAAVHRQGGYCRQPISRRPAQAEGDVAANRRGDAVAVWGGPARTRHPSKLMVAMGPADGRSPVIKHLSLRDLGAPGLSKAVRPQFRFVLSEAAEVRISIARRAEGRFRPVRSLVRSIPAGANHLTYGRAGGLRPGLYRARISARDCGGRRSRSQAVPFTVSD
jgi:hypothetical protein